MTLNRICLVILFFFSFQVAQAGELSVAISGWQSTGETGWAHNASRMNGIWGNPTSELQYKNIDSDVLEVGIVLPIKNDELHLSFGGGVIDSGTLVDDDYVSATGATYYGASQSGAHRISRTYSDIGENGLFYLNAEYHPQFFRFQLGQVPLQLYAGMQFWKEKYVATGVRQIECTDSTASNGRTFCNAVGFDGYNNQNVISNELIWTTWYVGALSQLELGSAMSLQLKLHYSPFAFLSNEDTHHLRTDLQQNPSFSMTGIGQAVDLQLDWRYHFSAQTTLSLGYRYWDRKVTNGDWYAYSTSGSSVAILNYLQTTRKGVTLGFDMVF